MNHSDTTATAYATTASSILSMLCWGLLPIPWCLHTIVQFLTLRSKFPGSLGWQLRSPRCWGLSLWQGHHLQPSLCQQPQPALPWPARNRAGCAWTCWGRWMGWGEKKIRPQALSIPLCSVKSGSVTPLSPLAWIKHPSETGNATVQR